MRAHHLIQLAAVAAIYGHSIIRCRARFPDAALAVYWTAARCRQERWSRMLKMLSADPSSSTFSSHSAMRRARDPLLDEVLSTEVLSRVWAAVCCALDGTRGCEEASPIANSVLAGHHECRNRVLNLMVYGYGLAVEDAVRLNRHRLRVERETDMLLALLAPQHRVTPFAFDPRRVRDWSQRSSASHAGGGRARAASVAGSILGTAYRDTGASPTGNEDLNRRIATSILACLPPGLFDSLGQPASPLQRSLLQVVTDVQGKPNVATYRAPQGQATPGASCWLNARGGGQNG